MASTSPILCTSAPGASPTRLFAGLPPGAEVQRMGLVEAIETVGAFLSDS